MVLKILRRVRQNRETVPTLYFVDPYGYPLPIPLMRELLATPKAEVLVNLMWYRINMDLGNPDRMPHFNYLFGHDAWQRQKFMKMNGPLREEAFLKYFEEQIGAPYHVRCTMPYSPEDNVPVPERRHKFLLIHFSSHPKAARVMKQIVRRAEKKLSDLNSSPRQAFMPFADPAIQRVRDLKNALCSRFAGIQIEFSELLDRTANLPHVDSEYRRALRELENEGRIEINRRKSKRKGISDGDILKVR
jgi:hypothetical protein